MVTKKDLIDIIVKVTGSKKVLAKQSVELIIDKMKEGIKGDGVEFRNFVTLKRVVRAEKKGFNIQKHKTIIIPSKTGVKAKFAKQFVNELN